MSDIVELSDADFSAKMRGLIHEAEKQMGGVAPKAGVKEEMAQVEIAIDRGSAEIGAGETEELTAPARPAQSIPEMLRPLVQGVQAIGRATTEQTQILQKLDRIVSPAVEGQKELPQIIADLKGLLETRNAVSRQMFDALHEELKSYKDGFLLDSVHRPMIRDLITLYDDLHQILGQVNEAIAAVPATEDAAVRATFVGRMENMEVNMEHNLDFILEVLARLEVQKAPAGQGKLDKRTQRAVAVEMAEDPDHDLDVVRSVKCGFLWKDRVVRAEEVVIKKWKEGFLVALQAPSA
jgi:molecular chaperone GrpE (heat shock protein)